MSIFEFPGFYLNPSEFWISQNQLTRWKLVDWEFEKKLNQHLYLNHQTINWIKNVGAKRKGEGNDINIKNRYGPKFQPVHFPFLFFFFLPSLCFSSGRPTSLPSLAHLLLALSSSPGSAMPCSAPSTFRSLCAPSSRERQAAQTSPTLVPLHPLEPHRPRYLPIVPPRVPCRPVPTPWSTLPAPVARPIRSMLPLLRRR